MGEPIQIIGRRVRELRREQGITQRCLAEKNRTFREYDLSVRKRVSEGHHRVPVRALGWGFRVTDK
jgi:hypothetical protein